MVKSTKPYGPKITKGILDNYFIRYTGLFVLIFSVSFSWFFINNKSLIWQTDGIQQYFVTLVYYGKYLRQIIRELLTSGTIKFPMFDFSIGYGSDILTTFNGNPIGDPLNLLSVFFTADKTEFLFCLLAVLRMYLSGIAFSIYCRYMKKPAFSTLIGAIIYAFCGFSLYVVVRHPFFLNPMIYLPLLLIGIEKILAQKRPYSFISMVLISAVSNFYFFYMLTIFLVIYTVIRIFAIFREERIKNMFRCFWKLTLYYITGLLTACVLFLPVLMLSLTITRGGIKTKFAVDALYSLFYYERFASAFITQRSPGYWNIMGYSVVSLVAVILLFSKEKEHSQLKIGFIILTVFLLLPIAGHIMHGFSYVSNRWIWGYSFVIALMTVIMTPDILKPTTKQLRTVSIIAIIYFLQGFISKSARSEEFFVAYAILFILFILMASNHFNDNRKKKHFQYDSMRKLIMLALITLGISIQAFYRFAPDKGNYINQFRNPGDALAFQTKNPSALIKDLKDESFFRYETNSFGGQSENNNSSILNQQNSTNYYFSLINPNIGNFLCDDNYYATSTYIVKGLESRAILGALASVKYFIIKPGLERYLPYGYEDVVYKNNEFIVLQNKYALPLGYTYDYIIPETLYQNLSAIQKQQALLQGAIVKDDVNNKLETINPQFYHSIVPYSLECGDGITYKDGVFTVKNNKAVVKLTFTGLNECETYLGMYNLHFSQTNPISSPDSDWAQLNIIEKIRIIWNNRTWIAPDNVTLTIKSGNISRSINNSTPYYQSYDGKHNYLVNLFYSTEGKAGIEISFSDIGNYSISDMEVICLPMETIGTQVDALKDTVLENVDISANKITGIINAEKDMLLCFSIPYNGGWKAYIDNTEVEMLNVNTMYSGIYLTNGEHTIELRYSTPYLQQGMVLSIVGLCLFCVIIVFYEKKRNMLSHAQNN